MKIAISGKGGVGKTTLAAFLIHTLAKKGRRVLAVDADPDANLGEALGFPDHKEIMPIVEMRDLIEERTGTKTGGMGGFFTLNPRVDDIPEAVCKEHNGIRLVVMGGVKAGGSGCVCPESVLLKALIQHLILDRDEAIVMDMEAGIEHLGRAVTKSVDMLITVVEPGKRAIDTALKVRRLAHDIKLTRLGAVGSKIKGKEDVDFIITHLKDMPFLGYIPFSEEILKADQEGRPPSPFVEEIRPRVEEILRNIE